MLLAIKKRRLDTNVGVFLLFAAIALIPLLWIIFQPPFASVDERAHVARAYTAANGHFLYPSNTQKNVDEIDTIEVPAWIHPLKDTDSPNCFWGRREITANCAISNWNDKTILSLPNQFAQYFPTFYAVAGIPSIFSEGKVAYYAMRLAGLFEFLAITWGLFWVLTSFFNKNKLAIPFLTLTPMTLLGAGTVAPLALETVSVVTLCVILYSLFFLRITWNNKKQKTIFYILFFFVSFTASTARPSGFVWSGIIWIFFIFSNYKNLKYIYEKYRFVILAQFFIFFFAITYFYFHRPKVGVRDSIYPINLGNTLTFGIQELGESFNNMVGIFGMDIYLPQICYYLFFGIFSYVAITFFENNLPSEMKYSKILMGSLILLLSTVSMIFDYIYREVFAYFWIGRYSTPLLGLVVTIVALGKLKHLSLWLCAGAIYAMNILAILMGFFRYSLGFVPAQCCGAWSRAQTEFLWKPFGLGFPFLATISLVLVVIFAAGASIVYKNSKDG